jgi:signal transduction histidine kinase
MKMPIRAQLTLWYTVVLTIILAAFAAGVYLFVAEEERAAVDRILRERAESFANALSDESGEQPSDSAMREVAERFARDDDIIIYDSTAKLVYRSPVHLLREAPVHPLPGMFTIGGARCIAFPAGGYLFVSAESLAGRRRALERLRGAFVVLIPIAILIAAVCGYFLASRSLEPLDAALLALERSLEQQKQLLADTSHELRTPVTIIRSEAEVTLSRTRDPEEYRRSLDIIRAESTQLTNLIEGVLLLARADAQGGAIATAPLPLSSIVDDTVRSLQRIAEARQVALTCSNDGPMPMRGNADLLRRMLLNLADNAIKFTDPGGWVRIDARRDGELYVIDVRDSGHGIPQDAQARVFDRFFRVDAARGRETGGTGLGLPIAQWIARAHGGDIRLVRSSAEGTQFQIHLPAD